jgi:hypothetical protein
MLRQCGEKAGKGWVKLWPLLRFAGQLFMISPQHYQFFIRFSVVIFFNLRHTFTAVLP